MGKLSVGEQLIRVQFEPGNNDRVQNLKEKFAHLVNDIDQLKKDGFDARLCTMVISNLEVGSILATKAATSERAS